MKTLAPIPATVLLGGLVLTRFAVPCSAQDPATAAVVSWAAENAVPIATVEPGSPFDDLMPVSGIVGDARVVLLGESRHDAREQFRLKHRLIEFLVQEMGFTLFAMEESLPSSEKINDYLLRGEGDPEALLNQMGAWYIWDTEEVLALIRWMRKYNEDPDHEKKVRFFGIDVSDPLLGLRNVLAYLDRVDAEYRDALGDHPVGLDLYSEDFWPRTIENYKRLSPAEVDALGERLEALVSRLEDRRSEYAARSSEKELGWIVRQALTVKRANDLFTTFLRGTFREAGVVREKAMVDNIHWLLNQEGRTERLIVWAHNLHVGRDPFDLDIPNRPPTEGMKPMAHYLSRDLGAEMVAIAFSFHRGEYPGGPLPAAGDQTVDGVLARVGHPLFIIDLRSAPNAGPVDEWLHRKQQMRAQGGVVGLIPARAYDALLFTEKITRVVPSARARERFEALDPE
ncbi:MAG: erythromycin esterase family protein [bacterium]|nr:erythromycin esterase family protein [bacterium]